METQVLFVLAESGSSADLTVALAGVIISAIVAWVTARRTIAGDERRALREGNMRLMEWAIAYPFLETQAFCDEWPSKPRGDEDATRYEFYCCHVFNVLEQCWEFCDGDLDKMKHILYPDELIKSHQRWWLHDPLNQEAYKVPFRQFVTSRIHAITGGEV
ncbi:hypothetical protein [Lacipirellula parvula]|uniref:Uncharacterized protein n=1 Tax=Lacipirellula parvula TaxID=2650471 RepID=A0A5K7X6H4_9BACT|nr:hypothetical protein [Lacipirellula parvula]BBO31965.1 hypothetical protein PLANPX_1577 [Lacipirellula parvula]